MITEINNIMELFVLITLNVVAAIIEAYFDVRRVKNEKPVIHWRSNIIRVASWALVATITHWLAFWPIAWVIVALAASYWLVFDYAYNLFFGHKLKYLSAESNLLDKFLLWISKGEGNVAFIIKASFFILSLIGYLLS